MTTTCTISGIGIPMEANATANSVSNRISIPIDRISKGEMFLNSYSPPC